MSGLPFAFAPNRPIPRPLDTRALAGIQTLPSGPTFSPLGNGQPVRRSFISGDQPEVLHVELPDAVIYRRPDLTREPNRDRTDLTRKPVQSMAAIKARTETIGIADQRPIDSRLQL